MTLLAGAIRLGTLALVFPLQITGDERNYIDTAIRIAETGRHYSAIWRAHAGWPPAHSFVLSQVIPPREATSGSWNRTVLERALVLETVISTALVSMIGVLGWALFNARTGILAALFAAVYPTFVAYSHYAWSETLFLFLLVTAVAIAVRAGQTGSWLLVALAGAGFGLSALTRELGLLLAGCIALWWSWTGVPAARSERELVPARKAALARGLLLLSCSALVIAPWTVRNYRHFDRLVPVSTVSWMAIREGNTLSGPSWLRPHRPSLSRFRSRYFREPGEMARMDFARREALEQIRGEQPLWLAKKLARNSAFLFSPDSFLFKKISRLSYGSIDPWKIRAVLVLVILSYLGVMIAGILGIALARERSRRILPLLVFAAVFTLHVVAQASSRYRLPLMPLMMIYAAHAVRSWRDLSGLSPSVRRTCAAVIALLLVWPLYHFLPDAASLWSTGHYIDPLRP